MAGMTAGKLLKLRRRYDTSVRIFVETGTFEGATTKLAQAQFEEVYTIELDDVLYTTASRECAHPSTVFMHGDSRNLVAQLAATLPEPVFWYLDAHWFDRPGVAGKAEGLPLWDELGAIAARPYADIVVVDDVSDFGKPKPTPEWLNVTLPAIAEYFPGYREAAIRGDQAVVYRGPIQ